MQNYKFSQFGDNLYYDVDIDHVSENFFVMLQTT